MATTVNLLSAENGLYTATSSSVTVAIQNAAPDWVGDNCTLSVIPTEFITNLRYALRIAPSGSGDVTIALLNQPLRSSENGKTLSFNAKVKPPSEVVVTTNLSVDGGEAQTGHQQSLSGGAYGAIQSNTAVVPSASVSYFVSASITISGHNGQNIYVTYPNLIDDLAFYQNRYVNLSRNFMPDFYWEKDSLEQYPTAPFHRLIDILFDASNEVMREYQAIYSFEKDEVSDKNILSSDEGQSVLVSSPVVRDKYINWLSQFTGYLAKKNIADAAEQPFFPTHGVERQYLEWQLNTSSYGRGAGTRQALIEAAQQVLIFTEDQEETTKAISITPNYNGNSWDFLVRTLSNETPDANAGESSHLVLAAMEPARPMGYRIFHTTIDEFYLTLDDLSFGRLGEVQLGPVILPTAAVDVLSASVSTDAAVLTFLPLSATGDDGGGVISNYEYALSTDGGSSYGAYQTLSPAKGSPPITITGLSSGQLYYVKLKAINEAGTSTFESTGFSFTTL